MDFLPTENDRGLGKTNSFHRWKGMFFVLDAARDQFSKYIDMFSNGVRNKVFVVCIYLATKIAIYWILLQPSFGLLPCLEAVFDVIQIKESSTCFIPMNRGIFDPCFSENKAISASCIN